MFVIPCKYKKESNSLLSCVNAIENLHPNEKVAVIDSASEDKSYFEDYANRENVIICDANNKNYEVGALWYAFKNFPNEKHYILIHDSLIFKKSISQFIVDDKTTVILCFNENLYNHNNSPICLREKKFLMQKKYFQKYHINLKLIIMAYLVQWPFTALIY